MLPPITEIPPITVPHSSTCPVLPQLPAPPAHITRHLLTSHVFKARRQLPLPVEVADGNAAMPSRYLAVLFIPQEMSLTKPSMLSTDIQSRMSRLKCQHLESS